MRKQIKLSCGRQLRLNLPPRYARHPLLTKEGFGLCNFGSRQTRDGSLSPVRQKTVPCLPRRIAFSLRKTRRVLPGTRLMIYISLIRDDFIVLFYVFSQCCIHCAPKLKGYDRRAIDGYFSVFQNQRHSAFIAELNIPDF